MNPLLLVVLGQVLDIALKAVLRDPKQGDLFTPIISSLVPAMSQAAGETAAETEARRKSAEAIFSKWADKPITA